MKFLSRYDIISKYCTSKFEFVRRKIVKMSIFEIISAIVLIIACVFIVVVVLLKDTKTQMSQTISGTAGDSFYQKNAGRTKEAMLNKATVAAVIIFFIMAIAVNVINVYWGASSGSGSSNNNGAYFESSLSNSEQSSSSENSSSETANSSENSESSDSVESSSSENSAQSDVG